MEKLVASRLSTYLELHSILYPNQFGFRSGYSISHSLISITERNKNTLDKRNYGCGVFIDLKKAFDTVNHEILLNKLEHYGIRDISLSWFKSYLRNRKQFVCINGTNSGLRELTCGVPQGSVLSPLLFLLYINDLPNISSKLKFYLFADDTNIYCESDDIKHLELIMNRELIKLHEWLCINRLSLNISKTNFVIFCPINKPKIPITIQISKKAIDEVKYVKYLGILIDSQFSFKFHIEELTKKISRSIGVLYKVRPFVSTKLLTDLYYAIIYPFLLYGILIWGNACQTSLTPLHMLQKRFVRMATFNDHPQLVPGPLVHASPLFHKLNILTIFDIFKLQLGILIYDSNNNGPFQRIITYTRANEIHSHSTRYAHRNSFFKNYSRTTRYGLKSLQVEGTHLWSSIPLNVREALSKNVFKNLYKNNLISKYI